MSFFIFYFYNINVNSREKNERKVRKTMREKRRRKITFFVSQLMVREEIETFWRTIGAILKSFKLQI